MARLCSLTFLALSVRAPAAAAHASPSPLFTVTLLGLAFVCRRHTTRDRAPDHSR